MNACDAAGRRMKEGNVAKKNESRRQVTNGQRGNSSNDRTSRVLMGAEKRLRRFARRRTTEEAKAAYREAANLVHKLTKK
jgi:hypothetical protein